MPVARSTTTPAIEGEHRTLDLRVEPITIGVLFAFAAPFFFVPGAWFAAGMLVVLASSFGVTALLMALAGVVFAGIGALLAYAAYRILTTVVRFIVTAEHLEVQWRRLGKVMKTERVRLVDIVEVAVSDMPSSGDESIYGLALGLRDGTIALSNGFSSEQWRYVESRDKLAAFLGAPTR